MSNERASERASGPKDGLQTSRSARWTVNTTLAEHIHDRCSNNSLHRVAAVNVVVSWFKYELMNPFVVFETSSFNDGEACFWVRFSSERINRNSIADSHALLACVVSSALFWTALERSGASRCFSLRFLRQRESPVWAERDDWKPSARVLSPVLSVDCVTLIENWKAIRTSFQRWRETHPHMWH